MNIIGIGQAAQKHQTPLNTLETTTSTHTFCDDATNKLLTVVEMLM